MKVTYICNFYTNGQYNDITNLEYVLDNDINPSKFFYDEIIQHLPLPEDSSWFMTYFTEEAE